MWKPQDPGGLRGGGVPTSRLSGTMRQQVTAAGPSAWLPWVGWEGGPGRWGWGAGAPAPHWPPTHLSCLGWETLLGPVPVSMGLGTCGPDGHQNEQGAPTGTGLTRAGTKLAWGTLEAAIPSLRATRGSPRQELRTKVPAMGVPATYLTSPVPSCHAARATNLEGQSPQSHPHRHPLCTPPCQP